MLNLSPGTITEPQERYVPHESSPAHSLRKWAWILLPAAIVILVAGYVWWRQQPEAPQYSTTPVTRGNIVRTVVSTGTVNPVVTVQVGSYVSGTIQQLLCDYNTRVKAGQPCAKIDPRPYRVLVDQAAANLASARAQLNKDQAGVAYAKLHYERDLSLQKRSVISQDTLDNDKSELDQALAQIGVDEASVKQRTAALEAAQVNLDYTSIVSPVDGVVVSRNIDVGQTVAASFQTPTLFLIARDLTKMQVDTNVSESDVGGIRQGQKAAFTVEAYPDKEFSGSVGQVRQAPITVQNVVTYDVVLNVDNPDFLLLPGMTANTRIITDERDQVLRVPIQALRFVLRDSGKSAQSKTVPGVWVLRNAKPQRVPVTVGLKDGNYAEITGSDLSSTDQVIVNAIAPSNQNNGTRRSPIRF